MEKLVSKLNAPDKEERLSALKELVKISPRPKGEGDVNNHIHTWYSFSPYSPSKAVWMSYISGLETAGIMDHDSVAGADEFLKAGRLAGVAVTSGIELRAGMKNSLFAGVRINNPDQNGVAYMAFHALPACGRAAVEKKLSSISKARGDRNRRMIENINALTANLGISLDYDSDILPLSKASEGGSVTERHLLFALSIKLISVFGRGDRLMSVLENELGLTLSTKNRAWLSETDNPDYAYDVLGVLKGGLVEKFYIDADSDECPDVRELTALGRTSGAIPAYAYLGDVTSSVTGDKRAQKFEDSYLDELFPYLKDVGFAAVTYMPSRNTPEQLSRLKAICKKYGLFEISGEDVNSPRQSFICMSARAPEFKNLRDAAWALIGSEKLAAADSKQAMFSAASEKRFPSLEEKINHFKNAAR